MASGGDFEPPQPLSVLEKEGNLPPRAPLLLVKHPITLIKLRPPSRRFVAETRQNCGQMGRQLYFATTHMAQNPAMKATSFRALALLVL